MQQPEQIHAFYCVDTLDKVDALVQEWFGSATLTHVLDGSEVENLFGFYNAVGQAVPLIDGFGKNLDALLDLFRTYGWNEYAGKNHVFVWFHPDKLLKSAPDEVRKVVDIMAGAAKELQVGEEADPEFRAKEPDWIPTRLDVVFACQTESAAKQIGQMASRLSDDWLDEFLSLEMPVRTRRFF